MEPTIVERSVTVLKVIQPNHFLVKEVPDERGSSNAQLFAEFESRHLNTYDQIDVIPSVINLPVKGSYVLVKPENDEHWYRGRVEAVLETSRGARVSTYLLDYGRLEMARKEWIRDMPLKFKQVPFQAFDFILPNLRPFSMISDDQLNFSRQSSNDWDTSAVEEIRRIVKVNKTATVHVNHFSPDGDCFGLLAVTFQGRCIIVNNFLLENKYASDILLEGDTDKVLQISDEGDWFWLGQPDTSTLVGDVYIRPLSSLSGRISKRSNHSSHTASENLFPRNHHRGNANVSGMTDSVSVSSLPLGQSSPNRPGLGRGHILHNIALQIKSPGKNLREHHHSVQVNGTHTPTSFAPPTPSAQSSQARTGLGRDLSSESRISSSNLKFTDRSRSSLSSNQDRHHSVSYSSSSTLSVSFCSADSDKTDKVNNSLNVTQEDVPPVAHRVRQKQSPKNTFHSRLPPKAINQNSPLPSVNRTHTETPKPSTRGTQNYIQNCQSQSMNSSFNDNKPSTLNNGSPNSRSSEKIKVPPFGRNGFVSRNNELKEIDPRRNISHTFESGNSNERRRNQQSFQNVDGNSELRLGNYLSTILRIGSLIPKPTKSLATSTLTNVLIQRMESLSFPGPSTMQSNAWPAILRGRSVAMIAPQRSGKTLAGLLPLLSFLLQPEDYKALDKCTGPLAVILCASWKDCQDVHNECVTWLPEFYHKKVACIFGGSGNQNKQFTLLGGQDLLITTPSCYLEIQKVVLMDRCCHVMLDQADLLTECFTVQIREIIVSFLSQYKNKPMKSSLPNQILLCSSLYTSGIESFIQNMMRDPIVLICSYPETAVYAKVPVYSKVTTKCKLNTTLSELLRNKNKLKTVVCTTSAAVAMEVSNFLKCQSIYSLVAHEEMEHFNLKRIKTEWEEASCSAALIVSDHVLPDMDITCAEWLIHYDIPQTSRLEFSYRFVCLAQNIQMKVNRDERTVVRDSLCHILLTPECECQSQELIWLLSRLGTSIPKQLQELGLQKQSKKPLCPYLQAFGNCKFRNWCRFRHMVKRSLDQPASCLPHWGEVKILVTHVVDASQFFGRLLEYKDPSTGATASNRNTYLKLQVQLTMYFGIKNNIEVHGSPSVGDICAVYKSGDAYHRVQVKEIHSAIEKFVSRKATVFLIDEGRTEEVEVKKLFLLPPEIVEISPQAVRVFACGVEPMDGHQKWTVQAGTFVHKNISAKEVLGKVALCLKDTLFLEPLVVHTQMLKTLNMITFNHSQELMKQGYAVPNSSHVSSLRKLFEGEIVWQEARNYLPGATPFSSGNASTRSAETSKSGDPLCSFRNQGAIPKYVANTNSTPSNSQDLCTRPAEAFVKQEQNVVLNNEKQPDSRGSCFSPRYETLSPLKNQEVFVSFVQNPHWFYVQPLRSYDNLMELNSRINNLVSSGKVKSAECLETGCLCLSPLGNDGVDWFRASVIRENSPKVFELFFVDFGDCAEVHGSHIFEITPDLLELPFQAVECTLADIRPVNSLWTEEISSALISLTREEDDIYKEMNLEVLDSASARVHKHQTCYTVKISEPNSKSIASLLVDMGLAVKCGESPPPLVSISDVEADSEYSPMSVTPEPPEAQNFRSVLLHSVFGENTKPFVETSDDESIKAAVRKSRKNKVNCPPAKTEVSSVQPSPSKAEGRDMPLLEVVPNVFPSLVPKVVWFQKKTEIILHVQVQAFQEYEFYCTPLTINLNILAVDNFFSFKEELFDKVIPTSSQTYPLGRSIMIKLHKCRGTRWLRLLKKSEKVSNISYDHDHLLTTSGEETGSMRSYGSRQRGRGKQSGGNMTVLHYDPCNMDDRGSQDTESDSDWSRENAYNMFS